MSKPILCRCRRNFTSKEELVIHQKNECVRCDACLRWYCSVFALQKHKSRPGNCVAKKCDVCGSIFQTRADLNRHVRTHTGEKPIKCTKCDQRFTTKDQMTQHFGRKHQNIPTKHPFNCDHCGLGFSSQELLTLHQTSQCTQCDKCVRWFSSPEVLKDHSCQPRKCEICGKIAQTPSALKRHMGTHIKKQPVKCTKCGSKFKDKNGLGNHMKIKHGIFPKKEEKCKQCHKQCYSKKELEHHLTIECKKCESCLKWYPSPEALKDHICLPRKCETCGKIFKLPKDLEKHTRTHTKEKPFVCTYCAKSFSQKAVLERHMTSLHGNGEGFVRCKKCQQTYSNQEVLENHQKSECSLCEKCQRWYPTPEDLKIHSLSKTCTPRKCEICGKIFKDPVFLINHMRTHKNEQGPRRFKCPICQNRLTNRTSLNLHLGNKHQIFNNNTRCPQCFKAVSSQKQLLHHMTAECGQCLKCLKWFPKKQSLEWHQRNEQCKPTSHNQASRADNGNPERSKNRVITSIKSINIPLRCVCGLNFPTYAELGIHRKTTCSRKCRFCYRCFFKTGFDLLVHEKICIRRNEITCSHCEAVFEKDTYIDHVRQFCPKRELNLQCVLCESSKDFDPKNVLQALEHAMVCRPKGNRMYYRCLICEKSFPRNLISLHIQAELMHSRLFENIERIYNCTVCNISYPNHHLLIVHNEFEHPCRSALLKKRDNEPWDVTGFEIDLDKKELLQKERKINQKRAASKFNGEVPLHSCFICFHPFHCDFVMDSHVRVCKDTYGVKASPNCDAGFITSSSSWVPKKNLGSVLWGKLSAFMSQKIWKTVKRDVRKNPTLAHQWNYIERMEKKFRIVPGCIEKWFPDIIKKYLKDDKGLEKQLKMIRFPKPARSNPERHVDFHTKNAKRTTPGDKTGSISKPLKFKCTTCGTNCKSLDELYRHKELSAAFFKRKAVQSDSQSRIKKRKLKVDVQPLRKDFDNLTMWAFNGTDPDYFCEKCRHPFHCEFMKECHVRVCEVDVESPDCYIEEE